MGSILLIEDDEDIVFIIRKALEPEHYVTSVSLLSKATELLNSHSYQLILLDVMLPDGDGFHFLSDLKNSSSIRTMPVLFLTGKSSTADQVLGFSLGAEDYMIKPIQPILLQARVNAKIKKYTELRNDSDMLILGDLKFLISKQKAMIVRGTSESEMDLTPLEFKLLLHFAKHEEDVFSRDQLISYVWGENVHIFDRTIDTHISHLRKKLKGCQYSLDSIHGVGYRLAPGNSSAKKRA
jgi:DNA-binding response OmpR family regulator